MLIRKITRCSALVAAIFLIMTIPAMAAEAGAIDVSHHGEKAYV